jgi:hypothetical protein
LDSIATDPALGSNSPLRIFMNVNLPQPFAPIRAFGASALATD